MLKDHESLHILVFYIFDLIKTDPVFKGVLI